MRAYSILACVLLFFAAAQAETALLECTANTRTQEYFLVQFRVSAIKGWTVEKALMLLHVSGKASQGSVEIAPIDAPWKESQADVPPLGKSFEAQERSRPDGWVSISLSPEMVQPLIDRKSYGFAIKIQRRYDSRQTIQYSPYLVVQGKVAR